MHSGIAMERARYRIHRVFGEASAICLEWRRSVEVCGVDVEREKSEWRTCWNFPIRESKHLYMSMGANAKIFTALPFAGWEMEVFPKTFRACISRVCIL